MKIYDSATHTYRPFEPREEGKVGIYLCGATVQGSPHIGHMRSAVTFDVLVRWLKRLGYDVTMVRNVTDIDDKILIKSRENNAPWWAWAYKFEQEFSRAYRILGIQAPTYEPRATGHITDMLQLIQEIIDAGHAYVGNSGNVYFDVHSLQDYGSLTHQSLENMSVDEETQENDKKNPHDFALWKAPKDGEPLSASWESPWGRGRPGWHIECSAMSGRYLGDAFDIHGGGIDLRFPHHENEQAQSHGAGRSFANYWMHNAWVTIDGEKMSKSLGNSLTVDNIVQSVKPVILRFALGTVHYRSTVAYSEKTLKEAENVYGKMIHFVEQTIKYAGEIPENDIVNASIDVFPNAFVEAMNNDLNVAGALASIHETINDGNKLLDSADANIARGYQLKVRAMLDVLGLDPYSSQWKKTGSNDNEHAALDSLVKAVLAQRDVARKEKNWDQADLLRDQLVNAGIIIEDGVDGTSWHIA